MFRNVKSVELVEIPLLEACVLPSAFKCIEELKIENGGKLESIRELKELVEKKKREEKERKRKEEEERRKEEEERERKEREIEQKRLEEERIRKEEERKRKEMEWKRAMEERERIERERKEAEEAAKNTAVISYESDWNCVDAHVGAIVVSDSCCNDVVISLLDLSVLMNLRELKVGSESCMLVDEVKLIGLSELESVVIGMNSFVEDKNSYGGLSEGSFYLKDCPKLRSLKIGRYSFNGYTVIEIESVDALETIEIGHLNYESGNFYSAPLELKSFLIHKE